ncbi:MAG: LysR family transcriptional regulator [Magnetovibrio sp.]|nr:LysR family transcriptional regulator [Magnetovibrio sp.]
MLFDSLFMQLVICVKENCASEINLSNEIIRCVILHFPISIYEAHMDIDLAKTFLAVYETGTFNRAAERLHVTQSTVSTRIINLEEQLGRSLFYRSRSGTELTAAGHQFHRHASNLVRVWQQAKQELVLPDGLKEVMSIGTQYTLWDELIAQWLPWMRQDNSEVAVRAEIAVPETLTQWLQEGFLDMAVMYMPQNRADLIIDKLSDDKLVLVSSDSNAGGPMDENYVYVDWGVDFQSEHAIAYPDAPYPALSISHGMLALTHILEHGGSGYFPKRIVRGCLKEKSLHTIKRAPWFLRPAYVVYYAERIEDEAFVSALRGLKKIAAKVS